MRREARAAMRLGNRSDLPSRAATRLFSWQAWFSFMPLIVCIVFSSSNASCAEIKRAEIKRIVHSARGINEFFMLGENGKVFAFNEPYVFTGLYAIEGLEDIIQADTFIALNRSGRVFTWAVDGIKTIPYRTPVRMVLHPPQLVNDIQDVIEVKAGSRGDYFIALRSDGAVFEWGIDSRSGRIRRRQEMTMSLPPSGIVSVATSGFSSVALRNDGALLTWHNDLRHRQNADTPRYIHPDYPVVLGTVPSGSQLSIDLQTLAVVTPVGRVLLWGGCAFPGENSPFNGFDLGFSDVSQVELVRNESIVTLTRDGRVSISFFPSDVKRSGSRCGEDVYSNTKIYVVDGVNVKIKHIIKTRGWNGGATGFMPFKQDYDLFAIGVDNSVWGLPTDEIVWMGDTHRNSHPRVGFTLLGQITP
jgi:hypothetical protein